jgi:hypothetical protein
MGTERGVVDRAVIPELFLRNGMPYNGSRGLLLVVADGIFAVTVICAAAELWSSKGMVPMLVLLPVLVSMLCSGLAGAYRQREDFLSLRFAVEHFLGQAGAGFISTALVSLLLTYGSTAQPSRGLMLTWPLLYFVPSLMFRRMMASRERRKRGTPIIALVGSEGDLGRLRGELHQQDWHGRSFCFDPDLFGTPESAAEAFAPCAAAGSDGACRWPVRRRKLKVRRPAPAQPTAHGPRHEELHVIRAQVRLKGLAFFLCNYLTLARHSERAAGGGRHDLWCVQHCG